MLDIKLFRETPHVIISDLKKRGAKEMIPLVDEVITQDKVWRTLSKEADDAKCERNKLAEEVAKLKKEKKDANVIIEKMKKLSDKIREFDSEIAKEEEGIRTALMKFPNILHETVPAGKDDTENVEIKKWGTIPKFDFPLKSHVDIIEKLDIADLERAANVSGSRFYYLKNELVLIDYALIRFALEILAKKGFTLVEPPYMIQRKPYECVTDMSDFEKVMYKIEGEDLYLIATSEHAIGPMHMNEILDAKDLPLKYAGVSPCFRKEAGSHGKDTKGIFRVHQFNKVEMFVFSEPKDSWKIHDELLKIAEEIFQQLKIPYHVVNICVGDMGVVASKKYDIEAWMPSQNAYREVVSCSNCTDFQSRRLAVRFRKSTSDKPELVHTLNSTAIATSRAMVAIIENYQQKDGTIKVPDVLVPYMGGITIIAGKMGNNAK
ncbi:MAG: serine--tRNA ligase [Nanoarchaeota archaeon]|nr:serine--tRNA ligase [Nanoarchaeota archaeon]MBU4451928.1 serine--tRNA ligase [Nanoarchaeota archaeon]MCG2723407.1 serine--tRNA ligase [archaeon]